MGERCLLLRHPAPSASWVSGDREAVPCAQRSVTVLVAGSLSAPRVVTGLRWRTHWIQGLTRGPLVVSVQASDWNTALMTSGLATATR